MNILFVVPYAPNQIRVRSYNLILALARSGHEVTAATLWERESERADLDRIREQGVRVLERHLSTPRKVANLARTVPTRSPLQAAFSWQPSLAGAAAACLAEGRTDAVHVEHLRGALYGLHLQAASAAEADDVARIRTPVVWDAVDCISHLFAQSATSSHGLKARLVTRLEVVRTRRMEARLLRRFPRTLVTSPLDREALLGLADLDGAATTIDLDKLSERVVVVPNGVDTEYFAPMPAPPSLQPVVVVTGKMSYHANETMVGHLVREIMPRVWRERPDVALWVVGKDPPAAIRRLATTEDARPPDGHSCLPDRTVAVTGTVPDLRPYLQRATVAVAPVRYGAGIQNKVLEAMACGLPVVASPRAVSALAVEPGRDLLVADDPLVFALDVIALLDDPERRRALAAAGRRYVEHAHSWDAAGARLAEVYREAVGI